MDKNKKALFRGAIGRVTDKILQQEVAKLKAPFVEALLQLALRLEQQHQEDEYYGDYSQLPGYKKGKNRKISNNLIVAGTPAPNTEDSPYLENSGIVKAANKENLTAGILGGLTSMKQYFDAKGQDIYTPDIFQDNPYRNQVMRTLAGMRVSPYGIMRHMQDMNRRAMYQVNNSGGLSGGLKYFANVASMLGSQENMANAAMAAQELNNKILAGYTDAGINLGKEYATGRMGANQYSTDYATKAHAAQLQGMQLGQQNFLGQLQQYMANKNKIDIYNGMRNVYQQDVDDKAKAAYAKIFG